MTVALGNWCFGSLPLCPPKACPQHTEAQVGDPRACWRGYGWKCKCLGSSPCLPDSTWRRAGSAVFTPCPSLPNTFMGIQSQAPALVSTAVRLDPRLLHGGLASQLLPRPPGTKGQVREHRRGRAELLRPRLSLDKPSGSGLSNDQLHLLCRPPHLLLYLLPPAPPSPGGGCCK